MELKLEDKPETNIEKFYRKNKELDQFGLILTQMAESKKEQLRKKVDSPPGSKEGEMSLKELERKANAMEQVEKLRYIQLLKQNKLRIKQII